MSRNGSGSRTEAVTARDARLDKLAGQPWESATVPDKTIDIRNIALTVLARQEGGMAGILAWFRGEQDAPAGTAGVLDRLGVRGKLTAEEEQEITDAWQQGAAESFSALRIAWEADDEKTGPAIAWENGDRPWFT